MSETRVSKITIARLHNCGNYEHVRYEIAVDVGPSDSAASVLCQVEEILNDLKPGGPVSEYELRRAKEVLAKPASELTDTDMVNMTLYRERIRIANEATKKRADAVARLNEFGGSTVYTDAKNEWDDHYEG